MGGEETPEETGHESTSASSKCERRAAAAGWRVTAEPTAPRLPSPVHCLTCVS